MTKQLIKTTSPVLGRSVRQRIADALEARIMAMTDGNGPMWQAIYNGDPDEVGNDKAPFVCIDYGTEEKLQSYGGCTRYAWPVFFHMRWKTKQGVDAQDEYLYYLAQLQVAVLENHNLGGLTENIEEDSNAHTILGISDAYPGGSLNVVIQYKTRLHNPFKSPHETL